MLIMRAFSVTVPRTGRHGSSTTPAVFATVVMTVVEVLALA